MARPVGECVVPSDCTFRKAPSGRPGQSELPVAQRVPAASHRPHASHCPRGDESDNESAARSPPTARESDDESDIAARVSRGISEELEAFPTSLPRQLAWEGVPTVGSVLRALHMQRRADRLSHLRSIEYDAAFVRLAHAALGAPLMFCNLRCGAWYVPPALTAGHCYFKSTDGHCGTWGFSLTRLNLQAALAAGAQGQVIVVDSTRSGKRFPDALTKTIPIWCCVLNRAIAAEAKADARANAQRQAEAAQAAATGEAAAGETAAEAAGAHETAASAAAALRHGDASGWDTSLHLPQWVPASEVAQIEARLAGWVASLLRPALSPVLTKLRTTMRLPLRPSWLCAPVDGQRVRRAVAAAEGTTAAALAVDAYAVEALAVQAAAVEGGGPFAWVHCVCASEACSAEAARERASWTYVQGAGDDDENWARGVTPEQWWEWREPILALAARSPEAAEAALSDALCAAQRGERVIISKLTSAASPADVEHRADRSEVAAAAKGASMEVAEAAEAADAEEAATAGNSGTDASGTAPAVPVSLPVSLWGSGLLLGPRVAACLPDVWHHADAILDVGGSIGAPSWANGALGVAMQAEAPSHKCVPHATTAAAAAATEHGAATEAPSPATTIPSRLLHVPVEDESRGRSKRAQPSKDWWQRAVLPAALRFTYGHLAAGRRVLICCERGDDRSATVAAAALLALFGEVGTTPRNPGPPHGEVRRAVRKDQVRSHLALLQGAYPAARISRALTKELNNFFVAAAGGWQTMEF